MNYSFIGKDKGDVFSKTVDRSKILYDENIHQEKYNNWKTNNTIHDSVMKNVYEVTPVGEIFFSEENIDRIQKKIKNEIYTKTQGKFILKADQNVTDLLVFMRAIFIEYGRNLDFNIIKQVKELNAHVVDKLVPDMITAIKQEHEYLEQLDKPITPIALPVNVSRAGRKTLPSVTSIFF